MTRQRPPPEADPATRPDMDAILGGRRMRRNRRTDWSRRLVRENTLSVDDLIWPIFLVDGEGVTQAGAVDAGRRAPVDRSRRGRGGATRRLSASRRSPSSPTPSPSCAIRPGRRRSTPTTSSAPQRRAIKAAVPDLGIVVDVALDPYTSHGHDGLMVGDEIVNDATVEQLCVQALIQAEAGADVIAPSDMMDGRVGAIRRALDLKGFGHVQIMAYTAKYASAFYGPFRDAVGTAKTLIGDKRTYQMDPANGDEALREAELDVAEGADLLMVKPGLPYLDILWRIKQAFGMPTFAYQVSGEYAMIEAAARNGWIDGERAMMESLIAFKRAGADGILTYFAPRVAERLAR